MLHSPPPLKELASDLDAKVCVCVCVCVCICGIPE